jgi:protein TonB
VIFTADMLEATRTRVLRWVTATVLIVLAHVGCTALAMMHWQEEAADDSTAGATLIEMVPAPAASVDADVAVGPRIEEAMLTPPPQEEVKEHVAEEQAKFEEAPLAPEPEVAMLVARPIEDEKPKEEEKAEDHEPRIEIQESAAPLTTAPPRVEPSEQVVKPAQSIGASARARQAQATWKNQLASHLNRFKRYPEGARAHGDQGSALVEFMIDRTGKVLRSKLIRSSGSSFLDEEAIGVLQRASPLPGPPSDMTGELFPLTLPIQFRIK